MAEGSFQPDINDGSLAALYAAAPDSVTFVEAKFHACARGRMPSARQEKVIGKARELEKLASVGELINDLAGDESNLIQT